MGTWSIGAWTEGKVRGWEHVEHGQGAGAEIGAQAPWQACTGWSEEQPGKWLGNQRKPLHPLGNQQTETPGEPEGGRAS